MCVCVCVFVCVCVCVYEVPLDDWTNDDVDMFFTYGEYGFGSIGM